SNSDSGGAMASIGRGYHASFGAAPIHYSLRYEDTAARSGGTALAFAGSAEGVMSGAATATATAKEPAFVTQTVAPRVFGTTADVERCALSQRVDRVVLSLSERRGGTPISQLLRLKFVGMKIEEAHDMYERTTGRILLDHLSPSWLFLADGFSQPRLVLAMKRTIDIVVSALA